MHRSCGCWQLLRSSVFVKPRFIHVVRDIPRTRQKMIQSRPSDEGVPFCCHPFPSARLAATSLIWGLQLGLHLGPPRFSERQSLENFHFFDRHPLREKSRSTVWVSLDQMGVHPNLRAGVTQVLVFGSICEGAMLAHLSEPRPNVWHSRAFARGGKTSPPTARRPVFEIGGSGSLGVITL